MSQYETKSALYLGFRLRGIRDVANRLGSCLGHAAKSTYGRTAADVQNVQANGDLMLAVKQLRNTMSRLCTEYACLAKGHLTEVYTGPSRVLA